MAVELGHATAQDIVRWAFTTYPRVAIAASFQAESGVLIDVACELGFEPDVITLDTGRLPEPTHAVMESFRTRYPIRLHVVAPDAGEVELMTSDHGTSPFRRSVELRHLCCEVRKVRPLRRALEGYDAWITGLRRHQGATRTATPTFATDFAHGGIAKIAPLASWTRKEVWSYISEHNVPVHPLYHEGYASIGCAPCTRAIARGEPERAGRWWWELDSEKECGLHTAEVEAL